MRTITACPHNEHARDRGHEQGRHYLNASQAMRMITHMGMLMLTSIVMVVKDVRQQKQEVNCLSVHQFTGVRRKPTHCFTSVSSENNFINNTSCANNPSTHTCCRTTCICVSGVYNTHVYNPEPPTYATTTTDNNERHGRPRTTLGAGGQTGRGTTENGGRRREPLGTRRRGAERQQARRAYTETMRQSSC